MPAYNFQAKFAGLILTGEKVTTLRPPRKHPTKPGDTLHLFTGMRTPQCRKLGQAICKSVTPARLDLRRNNLTLKTAQAEVVYSRWHEPELLEFIAQKDGFENAVAFFDFFKQQYGGDVFHGELITWADFERSTGE